MYYPMYHNRYVLAKHTYGLPIIITFVNSVMSIPIVKEI